MENQFLKVKLVEVTKCNIHIYKQIKLECLRLSVAFKIIVYRNGRFFQRLPTKTFFLLQNNPKASVGNPTSLTFIN